MRTGTLGLVTPRTQRASWHRWANAVVVAYLVATLVAAACHVAGKAPAWLLIHLLLLGAATNAIVVWSAHFASTLLHPATRPVRLGALFLALNAGVVGVLVGVTNGLTALSAASAALLAVVVAAHGWALLRMLMTAKTPRFAVTAWFYCAAGVALLFGVTVGAILATGAAGTWHARLAAAHVHANVFGWITLTVLGTQVSLWPAVLRTRIVADAETAARHALLLCAGGLTLTLASLLADVRVGLVAGLVVYILGVVRGLVPFVATAARRPPRTVAAWMLASATVWLGVALVTDLVGAIRSADLGDLASRVDEFVPWLVVGFVAQVLLGALTYLLPVVLGRGPASGRRLAGVLDRAGLARVVALNAGVALVALRLGHVAALVGWSLVAAAITAFVVLAFVTLATARSS